MKSSKFLLYAALGFVFWLNGVFAIRLLGPHILTEDNPLLILGFLIAVPVTVITIMITKWLGKCQYSELLRPITIMTFTATTLDAIAFTWFSSIYSTDDPTALNGAAVILWGAGLGLMMAYYLEARGQKAA